MISGKIVHSHEVPPNGQNRKFMLIFNNMLAVAALAIATAAVATLGLLWKERLSKRGAKSTGHVAQDVITSVRGFMKTFLFCFVSTRDFKILTWLH